METAAAWRALFESWPQNVPREGLVVTSFQEQIPFKDFMISGGVLMIERDKPDSMGGRKVMITYEHVSAVKLTSPSDMAEYQAMGFQRPF